MLGIGTFLQMRYKILNMVKLGELYYLIYFCNQVVYMNDVSQSCGTFTAFVALSFVSCSVSFFTKNNFVLRNYDDLFFFALFCLYTCVWESTESPTEKLVHKLQPCGKYLSLLSYVKLSSNSLWKEQVVFLGIGCLWDAIIKVTRVAMICKKNAVS